MLIHSYGITDPGCVRLENEDRFVVAPDMGYFAVVDGMGGSRNGAMAAELTLSTIHYYLDCSRGQSEVTWPFGYNMQMSLNANRLTTAIRLANRQVWKRADERPDFGGMGSTVAAVLIDGEEAAIANIGDSRVYLYRHGRLTQLTTDDTWLNAVLAKGTLDAALRDRHPMRNVLTQAVGSQNDVDAHASDLRLEPSDYLLLTTDGVHSVIGETAIDGVFACGGSAEELARRLLQEARNAGGPDNISCIVVAFSH